ncbi:MFS sugar transporter, putative, partial [Talaromyces stipitatus ATCC 10500]
MIVPMYNAECAPPEIRGLLVGLQQFSIEFGILISFWIDYGTNYIGGTGDSQSDAAWLVPLCLQLAPALILFVGMLFMPFSPRWLVHHGREDEARRVIAMLHGGSGTSDHMDEVIELEFLEIKAQSMFEKRSTAEKFPHLKEQTAWNTFKLQFVAIGSLFKTMPMFRRVIVATVTMFFQQWTGINAVLYYAPSIFGALGMSSNTTSLLATGVVGIVMFLTTIPMMVYVDRVGRKPVLIAGAIAMGINHLIIAIIFAKNQYQWPTHHAAGWAAIVMVWLFAGNFGWSWGPCAWIIVAEVWPLSARPYGIALGASSNWMNNFIVGQVTPDMITGMKYGTFIFFGLMTLLGSVFVWLFVPETKQLTLEEMDVIFGSQGVAASDKERMDQIRRELGLVDRAASDDFQTTEVKENDVKAE